MSKKKCSLKIFDGEKRLHGTAAQLKHISDKGGWDKFLEDYTENVVKSFSKQLASDYTNSQQKTKLKRVK